MKIYRVVPNSFAIGERLNSDSICSEEIYYSMGYTSFSQKTHYKNGKSFFLFIEDAIAVGHYLINNFHHLYSSTCSILEYDVPVDLILKHIGYGDYTKKMFPLYLSENFVLPETFIEKDDLGATMIGSQNIADSDKEKYFLQSFEQFLKLVINYDKYLYDQEYFYLVHFWIGDLSKLLDNFDEYRDSLIKSPLFWALLEENCELIPCHFITNKYLLLNNDLVSYTNGSYLNLRLDYSKQHRVLKSSIIENLDNSEPKENIRKLLKENNEV